MAGKVSLSLPDHDMPRVEKPLLLLLLLPFVEHAQNGEKVELSFFLPPPSSPTHGCLSRYSYPPPSLALASHSLSFVIAVL